MAQFRGEEIDVDGRAFPRQHRLHVMERWLARDELIEHQAERVDVAGGHDVEAVLAGKGPAIDVDLLTAKLSRKGAPDFMSDAVGVTEVIGRMCAPQRSDRYATLAEALDDLAICEA